MRLIPLFILFITIFSVRAMDDIASSSDEPLDTQKYFSLLHSLMQGTYLPQDDGLLLTDTNDYGEQYTITFSQLHDVVEELDRVMEKHVSNERRLNSLMKHSKLFFPAYNMMLVEERQKPIIKSHAAVSELVAHLRYLQTEEAKLCPLLTIFFECADVSFAEQDAARKAKKERLPHYANRAKQHDIYKYNLGKLLAVGRLKPVKFLEIEWNHRYSANILGGVEQLFSVAHLASYDDRAKIEQNILHAFKTSREIDIPCEEIITTPETKEIKSFLGIEDLKI